MAGAALLAIYIATLAPGVTFWDAGELIAAADGFGIPHPPGTPLLVAAGRVWSAVLGPFIGVARAMNLLSAVCTALAGVGTAWLISRRTGGDGWRGAAAALVAGTMMSVWANATETEVYAASLLHSVAMLVAASLAADEPAPRDDRWLLVTAYLIGLAPAAHLSALVAAPAAIVLASRAPSAAAAQWRMDRVALLGGALIVAAGVGRVSWLTVLVGGATIVASRLIRRDASDPRTLRRVAPAFAVGALLIVAASALLILLLRARHDPPINQGNPSTLAALVEVVARRQYAVASLFPRQAPVWLQVANVAQYVDWQIAMSWGRGVFTSPWRVLAAVAWLALAVSGLRAMRRDSRAMSDALVVLAICGTAGVALYLNLKPGASLGYGLVPEGTLHEARERDYFFVLGFWAWGCLAGYGAVSLARARMLPSWVGLAAALIPIVGNWPSANRANAPFGAPARHDALALLEHTPKDAVLFLDGDNDSYPIWYLQQVEGVRRDVLPVTVPLLPAEWYPAEISRRSGLRWNSDAHVPGARTRAEQLAALVSRAARSSGRPVAASPALPHRERALLGGDWVLRGPVFLSGRAEPDSLARPTIDRAAAERWAARAPDSPVVRNRTADHIEESMLSLLQCPQIALRPAEESAARDSLEVKCNLR